MTSYDVPLLLDTSPIDPDKWVEHLSILAENSDSLVRWAVAQNPDATAQILTNLAEDSDPDVRWAVACNPNSTTQVLAKLVEDPDSDVRRSVAVDIDVASHILAQLAEDPEAEVRQAVAENPNTPTEILIQLAQDPDVEVRRIVSESHTASADTLKRLAVDPDDVVRLNVARDPSSPPEVAIGLGVFEFPHILLERSKYFTSEALEFLDEILTEYDDIPDDVAIILTHHLKHFSDIVDDGISQKDMPESTTTDDPLHFVDAMGTTYKVEPVAATYIDNGLHAVPNAVNELLADTSESTLEAPAIEVRVSKKCWKVHCKRRVPGGKLISENKHTVLILATYDDIVSILDTVRWIRYDPSSPAIEPFEEQKHAAMLLRKAALQLDGRLHRILIAWDEANLDSIDVNEVAKDIDADFSSGDEGSIELSRQHKADLAAGLIATISLTEGASILLEEIGVEPDCPHPDAPHWGPGKHKVTCSILDDLEQRSVNIVNPVALESWKQAMLDKQGGGRSVRLESARKYGWGGIVNSQVASVGKGLARQIAKARAELDNLSEETL